MSEGTHTTKAVFVVVPANFEYNDETYNPAGHGLPLKAFTSIKKAEAFCLEQNLEELRNGYMELRDMGWDWDEVFKDGGKCLSFLGDIFDGDFCEMKFAPKKWTDEQCAAVIEQLRHPFFEVVEVEKG